MGKRLEAALKVKPYLMKGAQTLPDSDALKVKGIYPTWESLVGWSTTVTQGYKFTHADRLYKTRQPEYTFVALYEPGTAGTESLFEVIDEIHAGTLDDPIPYEGNMELFNGLYYSQDGVTYLCIRDSGQPLHHPLSALVGLYVEVATE